MNEVRISDRIKKNYEEYYEYENSEWRRIGAEGKANNIVSLYRDVPRDSISRRGRRGLNFEEIVRIGLRRCPLCP